MTTLEKLELKEKLKIQEALGEVGYTAVKVDRPLGGGPTIITAYQHTKETHDRIIADARKMLADT